MKWILIFYLAVFAAPAALSARNFVKADSKIEANWKGFKSSVDASSSEWTWVFFEIILPLIGAGAAIWGICQTVFSGNPKPLVTWVGIGIVIGIIPFLIDNIYGVMLTRL